jgi:hypothetical protein
MLAVEPKKKHKKKKSHRGSDAGSESTVTPGKFAAGGVGREGGNGSVMSLPVRGITPSMIGSGVHARSAVSYNY